MGDLIYVKFIDRKAQPDFYAGILAIFNALQCGVKCTLDASKAIIDFLHSIQADADIGKPDAFQGACCFGANQGSVCGNYRAHAFIDSILGQFGQVLAHQRFSAGKQDHRRAECGKIVD